MANKIKFPPNWEIFSVEKVRELRVAKGLTQSQMADLTKEFDSEGKGIHSQSVVWLETGRHKSPSIRTLELLKGPLGVEYWII